MRDSLGRIEAQGRIGMAEASPSQTRSVENQEQGSNVNLVGEKDGKKFRKLQLPVFKGENPLGWFFKAEQYFAVNEILEVERLQAISSGGHGRVQVDDMDDLAHLADEYGSGEQNIIIPNIENSKIEALLKEPLFSVIEMKVGTKEASDGMLSGVFLDGLKEEIQDAFTGSNIEKDNGDGLKGGGLKLYFATSSGFSFEPSRGSSSNKLVGFRPNYHRVVNILEIYD
ncbi:hypothetical protein CQW23_14369 [Capsicum baccatum]|uniref:Nitrite/Sulfite reductase ferredoxin-like domain-containing protein n=1 Tax=Capsicum baccatum TaxID=33114 RepID=A0A2G2WIZ9_CAPBA|nr:hypothetical protein CQW23_14369 [Capsicum baccatum]